jgi:hypothetical protein
MSCQKEEDAEDDKRADCPVTAKTDENDEKARLFWEQTVV